MVGVQSSATDHKMRNVSGYGSRTEELPPKSTKTITSK